MFKPEDFGFMGEGFVKQVKFHDGLRRLLQICLAIYGYDWKEFETNLSTNKSPIASDENFQTVIELCRKIGTLLPHVEKMNLIGADIGAKREKADFN